MGLDYHGVRLVAYTKAMNPQLDSIAMLGRQSLNTNESAIRKIFIEFKIPFEEQDLQRIMSEGGGYCEPLLKHMGFLQYESFDFNDYENPTHTHDFNKPISHEFEKRYDLVFDGGSLEHIFNFPIALRNCMQMVKPGGVFVTSTPCNNQCGHGLYQFSPEMYFSLMRGNNGYQMLDLLCHETTPNTDWHRMVDPDIIKNRVVLHTWKEIMMIVIARRTATDDLPEFQVQQSDYQTLWAGEKLSKQPLSYSHVSFASSARRVVMKLLPSSLKIFVRNLIEPNRFDSSSFTNADANDGALLKSAITSRIQSERHLE